MPWCLTHVKWSVKLMKKCNTDNTINIASRKSPFIKMADGYHYKSREGYMFGSYDNIEQTTYARQIFIYSMTGNEKDLSNFSAQNCKSLFFVEEV